MIWGRTDEEARYVSKLWRRWFAWRPVRLLDGRMAWLQVVQWRDRDLMPFELTAAPFGPLPRLWEYREDQAHD